MLLFLPNHLLSGYSGQGLEVSGTTFHLKGFLVLPNEAISPFSNYKPMRFSKMSELLALCESMV